MCLSVLESNDGFTIWYIFDIAIFCVRVSLFNDVFFIFYFSLFTSLPVSFSALVGGLWNTRSGGVAVGDPGELCHTLIIPPLPVSSQSPDCSGDDYYGDWVPWLRRSCQRKPSYVVECKYLP